MGNVLILCDFLERRKAGAMRILPSIVITLSFSVLALAGDGISYVMRSNGLQTPRMDGGRTELEFGDVNGDGHVDLVSIGDHGSPFVNTQEHGIMVWFGDGTGNWAVQQNGSFGYGGCALGDVNNDGLMDIGYGMHHDYSSSDFGDQLLEVALGDGTGTNWMPWDDGLATAGETWGMFGTDFADVDNDGDLDIGSLSFGCCAGVHVYLNNGDGTWTHTAGTTGGNSGMDFQFGDINGDGFADFAVAWGNGTVYIGDGKGNFTRQDGNLPNGTWRLGISLGDVNADGKDDIAFRGASGVEVWSWIGTNSWEDLSGTLDSIGSVNLTQIADMNLDGFGDILITRNNQSSVYTGDGTGNWTLAANLPVPEACARVAFRAGVDADHNGYPDITIISEEACDMWGSGTNRPRFYAEASTPDQPFVYAAFPRGGETWHAGSVRFVDWHAAVPVGEGNPTVTIEYSSTGTNGPWTLIAENIPNNGRFQWLVPEDARSSTNCFLRYTLNTTESATTITPEPFVIDGVDAIPAQLISVEIVNGLHLSGGVNELLDSDDTYVRVRSGFGETLVDLHNMEMVISAVTNVDAPTSLDLTIESRIVEPAGLAQIRIRNWNTNQFETVGSYSIGNTDNVDTINAIGATNYIDGSGNVGLSIKHLVFVPFLAFTFESFIDQVEIVVE